MAARFTGLDPKYPIFMSTTHDGAAPTGNGRGPSARRGLVMSEIYAQAASLFAERGFAGTSLQDIADATGFSRQALYHYVKSKDELLTQLVTEVTRSPVSELRAINARSDLDATGKLRAIAKTIAIHRAENPHGFLLAVRSEGNFAEELGRQHRDGKRAVLDEIVSAVEGGMRSGEFRAVDARQASLSILGMLNWIAWWYKSEGRDSPESIGTQMAEFAVAVVARSPNHQQDPGDPIGTLAALRQDLDTIEAIVKKSKSLAPKSSTAE